MLPVLERLGEPAVAATFPSGLEMPASLYSRRSSGCPVFPTGPQNSVSSQELPSLPCCIAIVQIGSPQRRLGAWPRPWRCSAVLPGCVRRRMTVRSNPPGAVVFVDDQEIGTTPASTALYLLWNPQDPTGQGRLRDADRQTDLLPAVVRNHASGFRQREPLAPRDAGRTVSWTFSCSPSRLYPRKNSWKERNPCAAAFAKDTRSPCRTRPPPRNRSLRYLTDDPTPRHGSQPCQVDTRSS